MLPAVDAKYLHTGYYDRPDPGLGTVRRDGPDLGPPQLARVEEREVRDLVDAEPLPEDPVTFVLRVDHDPGHLGVRALDLVEPFRRLAAVRAVLAVELEDHGLAGENAACRSMPSRAMAASSSPPPANATPAERPSAPSAAASCAPRPPSTPAAAGAAAVAPTAHAPPAHAVPAAESIVAPAAVAAVAPAATAAASGPSSVGGAASSGASAARNAI